MKNNILLKGKGGSPGIGHGRIEIFRNKNIDKNRIAVIDSLTPDITPFLKNASGVITDKGGITSHGLNILREYRIPCVVGTVLASEILNDDQLVTIDGWNGDVYGGDVEIEHKKVKEVYEIQTKIYAIVEIPSRSKGISEVFDGVGSLRSNYMILKSGKHPRKFVEEGKEKILEDLIYGGMKTVLESFHQKPVWYKLLDAPTNEFRRLIGGEEEPYEGNPLFGWRGIQRELDEPKLLSIELSAMRKLLNEGFDNLYVKVPFIRDISEYREFLDILQNFGLEKLKRGISVETPAVALSIDEFIQMGVDFVSIGVNDLTMCLLAVDRDNELVSNMFKDDHPVVLGMLDDVISKCRKNNIEICVSGRISDNLLKFLIGKIDIICYDAANVLEMRKKIYGLEKEIKR